MSNGSTTWTYTYNADGLRTSRSNGTTTYSYIYNSGQLSQMTVGSNTLYFAYDASGSPMSVTYNGTTYYYALNLQGDVMAILNTSGTAVVTYTYDAWGNILTSGGTMSSTLGVHNPLRYRGYVYDNETELYYLQSRYYNPEMGRFINADNYPSTGQGLTGNNMFAYCGNSPVNRSDNSGQLWHVAFGAVMGGLLSGVTKAIECINNGDSLKETIGQVLVSTACGAVGGALAATGIGVVGQTVIGAALGAAESAANQMISTGKISTAKLAADTFAGGFGGFFGGNGATFGNKFMNYHRKEFLKNANCLGIDEALIKLSKHTWNWAKSNLGTATAQSVGKSFLGNKMSIGLASIVETQLERLLN